MVIHIPDVFWQKVAEHNEKARVLKLLFYLFESNTHELMLTEKEDLQLFNHKELSLYREYVVKKAVRDSVKRPKTRHIVQLYPDRESITDVVKRIRESDLEAHIRTIINGARYMVTLRDRTFDLISYELISTFVGSPLKILVENIRSDKLFLQTVIKHIGGLNPDELFVEYLHGGGSTLLQVADEYKGKVRVFCLIDGDEVSPGEYISLDKKAFKQKVVQACKKYGYQYHVLMKREIENYIPDEALIRMGCRKNHLYFQLPEEHKDYFDMKEGLKPSDFQYKLWRELHRYRAREAAATANKRRSKRTKTKIDGFGRTVYTAFKYVQSKEELERRDGHGELEELVQKILDMV